MFTTAISCYSRFWTNDLNFRLMSEQELINYFIQTGACHYLKYDSVRKVRVRNPDSDLGRFQNVAVSKVVHGPWAIYYPLRPPTFTLTYQSNIGHFEQFGFRFIYSTLLRFIRLHSKNLMLILYFMDIILMLG